MGFHKTHTHGRVFRGHAARQELSVHRRDSHGNTPVMNVPAGFPAKNVESDVETAVSIVFVTLPQTFSGPAIFSTMTGSPSPAAASAVATPNAASPAASSPVQAAQSSPANDAEASYQSAKSAAQAINTAPVANTASAAAATSAPSPAAMSAVTASSPAVSPASTSAALAALAVSSVSSSAAPSLLAGTPLQASQSATAVADAAQAASTQSSGLSAGGKAGLAIGLLLCIGLAFGLIFFCWRRKKNQQSQEEALNEKHGSFADAGARRIEAHANRGSTMTEKVPASLRSVRTASTAPRLSLRPVTQFLPNLADGRKNSTVAAPNAAHNGHLAVAGGHAASTGQNPFDDAPVLTEKQARPISPPTDPFEESHASTTQPADAAAHLADASRDLPNTSEGVSEPSTPRSAQFATAAAVPVTAATARPLQQGPRPMQGAQQQRQPNNVHRVQLDFKPSMDDELELRSGQLVRMLHEYDDGWALCIRMDRSQQGVAPRTCLSKLPVKPRPQGPPGPPGPPGARPGPGQAPRSPPNQPGFNGSSTAMMPRPLSPPDHRAASPEDPVPASAASAAIPQRKPVPGQAM